MSDHIPGVTPSAPKPVPTEPTHYEEVVEGVTAAEREAANPETRDAWLGRFTGFGFLLPRPHGYIPKVGRSIHGAFFGKVRPDGWVLLMAFLAVWLAVVVVGGLLAWVL